MGSVVGMAAGLGDRRVAPTAVVAGTVDGIVGVGGLSRLGRDEMSRRIAGGMDCRTP
jgi:hypothetical protein